MGKRNPVKLVSAVVKRKSTVVTGNLFKANIPPTTISPLPIAIRVNRHSAAEQGVGAPVPCWLPG
jgi:hypothetical protein